MKFEYNEDGSLKVPFKKPEPVIDEKKIKIKDKLIEFGEENKFKGIVIENYFTPNREAEKFLLDNPLAFVFAVILDQSIKAERAWEAPFEIKNRIGHLDIHKIAEMSDEALIEIFDKKPKLHRFPKTMALRIKNACILIIEDYKGDPENIWNDNPKSSDLQNRFEEFDGMGQKKASMAANILIRDLGVKSQDKKGIDISYDVHVRRVFLRTGLVENDDRDEMVKTARKLNPEYPGVLDLPSWMIGRKWCHPNNPNHDECPLKEVCYKLDKDIRD